MAKKITSLGLPVLISINHNQRHKYLDLFPPDSLIEDITYVRGPLRGLLSAHEQFPDKDILLLGCDLIDMDTATLEKLISNYKTDGTYEYYTYMESDFAETLCSIYTSKVLKGVANKAKLHKLTIVGSLSKFLYETNLVRFTRIDIKNAIKVYQYMIIISK